MNEALTLPAAGSQLLPLVAFMAVQSITPGPNNLMLATAGATSGFRATWPHMAGIVAGMLVQIGILAAGLAPLLHTDPRLLPALGVVATAYLVWLAIRLALAKPPNADGAPAGRPLGFFAAALFQWVNPKAWVISLTVATVFWPGGVGFFAALAAVSLVTLLVNLPCISLWAAAGVALRRALTAGWRWRVFNGTMSAALLATAATLLP